MTATSPGSLDMSIPRAALTSTFDRQFDPKWKRGFVEEGTSTRTHTIPPPRSKQSTSGGQNGRSMLPGDGHITRQPGPSRQGAHSNRRNQEPANIGKSTSSSTKIKPAHLDAHKPRSNPVHTRRDAHDDELNSKPRNMTRTTTMLHQETRTAIIAERPETVPKPSLPVTANLSGREQKYPRKKKSHFSYSRGNYSNGSLKKTADTRPLGPREIHLEKEPFWSGWSERSGWRQRRRRR